MWVQVYSHGGDVMRFAGDSVICAFLPTAEEADSEDKGLATATQRAVRCAAVLANDLGASRAHICQLSIMAGASGVLHPTRDCMAHGQHERAMSGCLSCASCKRICFKEWLRVGYDITDQQYFSAWVWYICRVDADAHGWAAGGVV